MDEATWVFLVPQPSAIVIGVVIAAALATLVLTLWAWWSKRRAAFLLRRMDDKNICPVIGCSRPRNHYGAHR